MRRARVHRGRGGRTPLPSWRDHPQLWPTPGHVLLGYYVKDSGDPLEAETALGRSFDVTIFYWKDATDVSTMRDRLVGHLAAGRVPRISIDTTRAYCSVGAPAASHWADVAAGVFDGPTTVGGTSVLGLRQVLQAIADAQTIAGGQRLFVSPWHEMDIPNESGGYGGVRAGTPAEFRAAWQHLHALAAEVGVDAVWHFCGAYDPTGLYSGGVYRWGDVLTDTGSDGLYPGHAYVDWVGGDPYNWAGVAGHGEFWRNPSNTLDAVLEWWESNFEIGGAASGDGPVYKPLLLGETGVNERWPTVAYTGAAGDALDWMRDLVRQVTPGGRAHNKILGLIWFGRDYATDADRPPAPGQLMSAPDWSITEAGSPQKWTGLQEWGRISTWRQR